MSKNKGVEVVIAKTCMVNRKHVEKGDKVTVTEAEAYYLRQSGTAQPEKAVTEKTAAKK